MKRNTLGIVLLAAPIPLIVITLSLYAMVSFVLASSISAGGDASVLMLVGKIFNVLLGLIGLAAIIGVPVGMPIGIYLLCTPDQGKK